MNPASSVSVDLLSEDNYDSWKIQMRAILIKNGYWKYVNGTIKCPDIASGSESSDCILKREVWLEIDEKAMSDIILSISPSELRLIKNCKTSSEIWFKLEKIYESKERARKANLFKRLIHLKMSEEGDVREHCKQFFDILDKLEEMEIKLNEDLLSFMLLYSLPERFEDFRCSIEAREELPKLDDLRIKVIEEENARRRHMNLEVPEGLIDRFNPQEPTDRNSEINEINTSLWCLDSGCTSHLCNDINKIRNLKIAGPKILKLSNRQSVEVEGWGSVSIRSEINNKISPVNVKEVLYVPKLEINVLSIGIITDKGFMVEFDKKEAKVKNEFGEIILTARRCEDLYCVKDIEEEWNSDRVPNENLLKWHQKLGHLNFHSMRNLCERGILRELNSKEFLKNMECQVCLEERITRPAFPRRSENRTSRVLEIVHSDVYGPMKTESIGGNRYFVTFTDEHSRWTEVYFLNNKSDVFKTFKDYNTKIVNLCGKKITYLQSDYGKEYINKNFDEFLREEGIQRILSVADSPQQDGLSENINRSLTEMARCLLIQSGLPGSFWGEAINTANYIRNRCPLSCLDGKTPFDVFFGRPPSVECFQTFGTVCYIQNQEFWEQTPKSEICVFMGYLNEETEYKIYNFKSKKCEMVREIKFLNQMYKMNNEFEEFFTNESGEDYLLIDEEKEGNESAEEEFGEELGCSAETINAGRQKMLRTNGRRRPRYRRF